MILLRVSGHSGAGKSRLWKELERRGVAHRRVVLFTTRPRRPGEVEGVDYHFATRDRIRELPADSYFVGKVRDMLQAVDLAQLEGDLRTGELVVIEIFHRLWLDLEKAVRQRVGDHLRTASVFLCAVDVETVRSVGTTEARARIEESVRSNLAWRATENERAIALRARTAVTEVLDALTSVEHYDLILQTSPEGPYGQDDWTCPGGPREFAAKATDEFITFIEALRHH